MLRIAYELWMSAQENFRAAKSLLKRNFNACSSRFLLEQSNQAFCIGPSKREMFILSLACWWIDTPSGKFLESHFRFA